MTEHGGWAYIMSSPFRRLYIGVTSDLHGRVWKHKSGAHQLRGAPAKPSVILSEGSRKTSFPHNIHPSLSRRT
jgi:hypothetical protein